MNDVSPQKMMKISGHKQLSTLERYMHLASGSLEGAIEGTSKVRPEKPELKVVSKTG
jgi:hypothetical protein